MIKKLYFILSILLLFTGCSKTVVQGLHPNQADKTPLVMVAKTDIICDSFIAKKGTLFEIKEMSGVDYKILSNFGAYGDAFNMMTGGNSYTFDDNVLLLIWNESMDSTINPGRGFVVFPNGKFAYDDYFIAVYNSSFGGRWWLSAFECEYNAEYPFEIKEN